MYRVESTGIDELFETAEEAAKYILDEEEIDNDLYDDMLNEVYGDVEICGYKYSAAYAFEEVDPIAYRCGLSDWKDDVYSEQLDEIVHMLESLYEGDDITVRGYTVTHEEDKEDNEESEEEE